MDVSNVRPTEETLGNREPTRPVATTKNSSVGTSGETGSTTPPEHGGITAVPEVEDGEVEDATAEQRTRDRATAGQSTPELNDHQRDLVDKLNREARLPTNSAITIEIDDNTKEPHFFVRNKETGAVLREVPDADLQDMLTRMQPVDSVFLDEHL